ncbi:DASH family cryptochrome [Vreelandella rituensis]
MHGGTGMTADIVWLQDDLRIADNPLFHFDTAPDQLLCLYVLDQHWLKALFQKEDASRMGSARLRFIWQSLMALRGELLKRGSDLLVRIGSPDQIVGDLAKRLNVRSIRVRQTAGVDERRYQAAVRANLPASTELQTVESGLLLASQSLPFASHDLPTSFSAFRRQVEAQWSVPSALPAPITLPPWPDAPRGFPALQLVCEESASWQPDARQGLAYVGGEEAAHQRLEDYLWHQGGVATYKQTRNGLLGAYFSTRLSPWLAQGCLSARQVYGEVRRWEACHGANDSSYWVIFELLWREYFYHAARLEGVALFGSRQLPAPCANFNAWRDGKTGVAFIDAAMLELKSTGWLSNRARQNVASFLVKDLNVDWRLGAAWFEHCLIDYDVASNWGNWRYVAGVGCDPRKDRYFDVLKQAEHYDPDGLYVAHWLP